MSKKLPEGEGKRHAIAVRTTRDVLNLLQVAASHNGRSVSAEVEARLLDTFVREGKHDPVKDIRTLIREEICAALSEQHTPEDGSHPMRGSDTLFGGHHFGQAPEHT